MYGLNSLIKMAVTLAIIALASHNIGPFISVGRTPQLKLIARNYLIWSVEVIAIATPLNPLAGFVNLCKRIH